MSFHNLEMEKSISPLTENLFISIQKHTMDDTYPRNMEGITHRNHSTSFIILNQLQSSKF